MKKTTLLAALLSATALLVATPGLAQISVNISIAPPQPVYESAPMMAPGHVWAPGYWAWHNDRYVWIRGRTIAQRAGYRWEPDHWEQRGNTYYRQPGNWIRATQYAPVHRDDDKKPKNRKNNKHGGNSQGGKNGHDKKHDN